MSCAAFITTGWNLNYRRCGRSANRLCVLSHPVESRRWSLHWRACIDPSAASASEPVRLVPDHAHFVEWVTADTEAGRASIVMFKASWCHACANVYPRFLELASQQQASKYIRCYAVQFDENKKLCRSLGVTSLPYFQVYGGPEAGMCLEERSIGPKRLAELDELFTRYNRGWHATDQSARECTASSADHDATSPSAEARND